jgi:hypothetical protein
MTYIWVLNFTIPLVSMIGLGILIDHMSKPDKAVNQEVKE